MLAELEFAIIDHIRKSSLAPYLNKVDSLPDLSGNSLLDRFTTEVPCIYTRFDKLTARGGVLSLSLDIKCVAQNSRWTESANGRVIGLYPMLDYLMPCLDGAVMDWDSGKVSLFLAECNFLSDPELNTAGLNVAALRLECTANGAGGIHIPTIDDIEPKLSEFLRLGAYYDIAPFSSKEEHEKWVSDPHTLSGNTPDLYDLKNVRRNDE